MGRKSEVPELSLRPWPAVDVVSPCYVQDSAQYLFALEEEKRLKRAARFSASDVQDESAKKAKTDAEEATA